MGYKLITQIALTVIALVIILTYIKPTLLVIGEKQDDLYEYADASDKAAELNRQLSTLVATTKTFSTLDIQALDEYLPSSIDTMKVMADIVTMAENSDMRVETITSGELTEVVDDIVLEGDVIESDGASSLEFEVSVQGSYKSFKEFLQALEQNKYPLEVSLLSFSEFLEEENLLTSSDELFEGVYTISLLTYAYKHVQN